MPIYTKLFHKRLYCRTFLHMRRANSEVCFAIPSICTWLFNCLKLVSHPTRFRDFTLRCSCSQGIGTGGSRAKPKTMTASCSSESFSQRGGSRGHLPCPEPTSTRL